MEKYTVKQVSELFGVSVHTIRYYDNEGLFPDLARGENGERLFTKEQLDWMHIVLCLRSTGLSVAGIRHYIELSELGDATLRERYQILLEQKERARAELEAIQTKLQVLERKVAWYETKLEECPANRAV